MTVLPRSGGQGGGSIVSRGRSRSERAAAPREKLGFKISPELAKFVAWSRNFVLENGETLVWDTWQLLWLNDFFSGVTECWLIVPEGNGKTTMVAALALYHCEHTPYASVPIGASSREQAEILFKQAQGFVIRTPELHDTFECLPGHREIRCATSSGLIKVFAADQKTADGAIPTLALCEEMHRQKDMGLYDTWMGKTPKRNGQIVAISTAGEPGSAFEAVRDGIRQQGKVERKDCFTRVVTPHLIMHEYAVPEDGDVENLKLVKMANPSSRVTPEVLEKKRNSPTWNRAHWERMVCNRPTRGGRTAVTEAEWVRALSNKAIPRGQPIWLGVDLAFRWDTTALVPYWQPSKTERYFGVPTVLVPPRNDDQLSPDQIEAALRKIHERNQIAVVAMDPNKGEYLAAWCKKELGARIIERKRTPANAEIEYSRFMEALRQGWLHHPGDPTLTQHVMNATTQMNPFGAVRFEESHATRHENTRVNNEARVIDALSAASMVLAAANEDVPVDDRPKWRLLA